jgi:pimeloyl-ACP methyl ester carboxylesterase
MASDSGRPALPLLNELEAPVWGHWGLEPGERILDVGSPSRGVRVEEVGSGPPVVLVHGASGYGPYWAPLVSELGGYRCLMLDRPGFGGTDPVDYSQTTYRDSVADLMAEVLDELGVEKVHSVGASMGDVWALALATKYPDRVLSVTLLGAGPVSDGVDVHMGLRLLRSPLGALMVRVPWRERMERAQARQSGHEPALDDGRIPQPYLDWKVEMTNRTDWRVHERAMVRAVIGRGGWKPGLTFNADELSSLSVPILMVCGTSDPGFEAFDWEGFIAQTPDGAFDLLDGAGHEPWFEDPDYVANSLLEHFEKAVE